MLCDRCIHALNCPAKAEHGGAIRCSAYKPQEQTNEEWLRSATTEQLAECIIGVDYGADDNDIKIAKLVEWLKQPHTKE